MKKKLQLLVALIILPFLFNCFSYFGYVTAYSGNLISRQKFIDQYDSGIYKYRILSKHLLLETDKIILKTIYNPGPYLQRILSFLDSDGTVSFYLSYFFLNTFFLILSCIILYLLGSEIFSSHHQNLLFVSIYIPFVIITQYVLVPYDYSSHFFIIITSYFLLRYLKRESYIDYSMVLFSIFISTLNRETSALSVSFILTVFYMRGGIFKSLQKSLPFILSFIAPYLLLRFFLGFDNGIIENWRLEENFKLFNLVGIIFSIVTTWYVFQFAEKRETQRALSIYLICVLPYIVIILISGSLFEIRLWTPVLINMIILLLFFDKTRILIDNTPKYI